MCACRFFHVHSRLCLSCTCVSTNLNEIILGVKHYIMSLSFKFPKDLSFCCGDIFKIIQTFQKSLIFNALCIFSKFDHQSFTKIGKIHNFKMSKHHQKLRRASRNMVWQRGSESHIHPPRFLYGSVVFATHKQVLNKT